MKLISITRCEVSIVYVFLFLSECLCLEKSILTSTNNDPTEGDNILLSCEPPTNTSIIGHQSVEAEFFREGKLVGDKSENVHYHILWAKIGINDDTYTCKIYIDNIPFDLSNPHFICLKPKTPTLKATPPDPNVGLGRPVTLTCNSESSNPKYPTNYVFYFYYFGSKRRKQIAEGRDISYVIPADVDDSGIYTCVALIKCNTPSVESSRHSIIFGDRPATPTLTADRSSPKDWDNITLTCSPPGKYQYNFLRGSTILAISNRSNTYLINNASIGRSDGSYTCKVINLHGVSSDSSSPYIVRLIPKTPRLIASPLDTTIASGTIVTLTCETAYKVSYVTYEFLHNDTKKAYGVENILDIPTSPPDSGRYTCVISRHSVSSLPSDGHTLRVEESLNICLEKNPSYYTLLIPNPWADIQQTNEFKCVEWTRTGPKGKITHVISGDGQKTSTGLERAAFYDKWGLQIRNLKFTDSAWYIGRYKFNFGHRNYTKKVKVNIIDVPKLKLGHVKKSWMKLQYSTKELSCGQDEQSGPFNLIQWTTSEVFAQKRKSTRQEGGYWFYMVPKDDDFTALICQLNISSLNDTCRPLPNCSNSECSIPVVVWKVIFTYHGISVFLIGVFFVIRNYANFLTPRLGSKEIKLELLSVDNPPCELVASNKYYTSVSKQSTSVSKQSTSVSKQSSSTAYKINTRSARKFGSSVDPIKKESIPVRQPDSSTEYEQKSISLTTYNSTYVDSELVSTLN